MKSIPVYKFKDLSPEAQQKAIEGETKFQAQNWSGDFTVEYWKEKLADIGFENAKIQFSGFWNQGDGASFIADINSPKILAHLSAHTTDPASLKIYKRLERACADEDWISWGVVRGSNCRYAHKHTCYIETINDLPDHPLWEGTAKAIHADLESLRLDLCREIYVDLEADYNDQTSEETARETLEDDPNDLWFFVDGKPCYYGED